MDIIHQTGEYIRLVFSAKDDGSVLIYIQLFDLMKEEWIGEDWTGQAITLNPNMIEPVIHNLQRIQKLAILK